MSIKANSPLGREILSRFNTADRNDTRRQERKADAAARTAEAGLFDTLCVAHGVPIAVHEYVFARWEGGRYGCAHLGTYKCRVCGATRRRWRFDFCWPSADISLEVQGGAFIGGRHVQGASLRKEHEKLNMAVELGWSVLFCLPEDIESGAIFETLKRVLLP